MPTPRRTIVYGPAYLDRVLRVDRPLLGPREAGVLDGSAECLRVEIAAGPAVGLLVVHRRGRFLVRPLPDAWPGPSGTIITEPGGPSDDPRPEPRPVSGLSWIDDLGGMGAGYARAFHGALISALGAINDPMSGRIAAMLAAEGVAHRPIRVPDRPADWTLLVTSGPHGDKLAIGFRGCHAALRNLSGAPEPPPAELVVIAGLPNRLVAEALDRHPDAIRFVAPAMRNMLDRDPPLSALAANIDILSGNTREWEALEDRDRVAERLAILAITDGPAGSRIRFRTVEGPREIRIPAFPREAPPRDTNRAGEAYASTLVTTLLDTGWRPPEPVADDRIRFAAVRASAAAALVLDRERFGFPDDAEIEAAMANGRIPAARSKAERC